VLRATVTWELRLVVLGLPGCSGMGRGG
jgi:hypothetical protein